MGAYVVTETGVVIEYPNVNQVTYESSKEFIATLRRRENGQQEGNFIAYVPRGCIVSFHRPGVVKQAADARRMALEDSVELTAACVRTLPTNWANVQRLKKLKAALSFFDARSGCWK